jgi:hypothetical protein
VSQKSHRMNFGKLWPWKLWRSIQKGNRWSLTGSELSKVVLDTDASCTCVNSSLYNVEFTKLSESSLLS